MNECLARHQMCSAKGCRLYVALNGFGRPPPQQLDCRDWDWPPEDSGNMASEPVHLASLDVQGVDGDARRLNGHPEGCGDQVLDAFLTGQGREPQPEGQMANGGQVTVVRSRSSQKVNSQP